MKSRQTLAIIGSGPSCIYLLKNLLDHVEVLRESLAAIEVFEKRQTTGMGMPYNPETTERWNMSNISSEELPKMPVSLAEWLRGLTPKRLQELGIEPGEISESEVYSRLALGEYLHAHYHTIMAGLAAAGIAAREHAHTRIVDVKEDAEQVTLLEDSGTRYTFDQVVIATGHHWPEDDEPERGYYVSPWPISKLLPAEDEVFNFPIGTLGASLSAFDVVSSLAYRHGQFVRDGARLVYHPHPGTEEFRLVMHSSDGLLPHLQYGQARPLRAIERYVSEKDLLALRDADGFLRLETYFDRVCRPVFIEAFKKNGTPDLAAPLEDPNFGIVDFAEKMKETHSYEEAFDGMRWEMKEATESVERDRPIHWKEALDDLMYTLNFYAEMMPAEDHLTLHSKFMPFLMNVIAALPLPSARVLLALRDADKLSLVEGRVTVEEGREGATTTKVTIDQEGEESETSYRMFVNCAGQKPLEVDDYPFPSLIEHRGIRAARARFQDSAAAESLPDEKKEKVIEEKGSLAYAIGGVDIDRGYRLVGEDGRPSERIFDIAFPHTSGERPYSYGLQACNDTARILVTGWLRQLREQPAQAN
ncbi:MAG: FAD/NAD(P)-binding protein [Chthoniobacterales bacterium]